MGSEFEINGIMYRTSRLDAFKQLYITRRLAPSIGKLLGVADDFDQASPVAQTQKSDADIRIKDFIQPVTDAIYALSDKDMDFVIKTCLKVVRRKDVTGGWVPVIRDDKIMFEDMDLVTLIRLVAAVIKDNLMAFSSSLPSGFKQQMETMISRFNG